jgi:hypothetical protein
MQRLFATVLVSALGLAAGCASTPVANTPVAGASEASARGTDYSYVQDVAGCDGVDTSTLQSAYDAALRRVREKRWNEAAFRAQIKGCAATDLLYFRRVVQR